MKQPILRIVLLAVFLAAGIDPSLAQNSYWADALPPITFEPPAATSRTLRLALPVLRDALEAAARGDQPSLNLPMPDGSFVPVTLEPVSILVPQLQAEHPGIRTYRGTSPDEQYDVRLTISEHGLWAKVWDATGKVAYIQPLAPGQPEWSVAYFAADVAEQRIPCGVAADESQLEEVLGGKTAAYSYTDANLRSYRLCVVASGEYTVWAGGGVASQSAALAYITATVNNVTAVMERDMGITFTLNSPNSILYTDPATDPFNNSASAANLTACSTALATIIGNANYDIGHLVSAGFGGGLASVGVVCGAGKGRGESGASSPTGSYFDNVVMHEIGHQFSATHTFSANTGGCAGNGSYASGWEPGGGNTIMSYSGLCAPNDPPGGRVDCYHAGSLSQMGLYVTLGTGSTCPVTSQPSNAAPVITTATAITIPQSTPFKLTATATDANNSGLTYTYDQIDAIGGTTGASSPPASTNTTEPNFRSFFPSSTPTRYLPNLKDLYAGTPTLFEVPPSVVRTMNFRATVRDNNPGFGRTHTESVTVTTASCGPFSITSQGTATSLTANGTNTLTVTWNTASACVTCTNVTLLYTRDRGATYSTLLASTANDGSETITVPNIPSCDGRLYLECATAPFFDVTSAPITISSGCAAAGATFAPSTAFTGQSGSAALNQSLSPQYGTAISTPLTGTVDASDPPATLTLLSTVSSSCVNFSNATRYETRSFQPGTTGTHTFTGNVSGIYNLYDGPFNPNDPCDNWIASSATYNGSTYSTGTAVSASLCRDRSYTLVISFTGTSSVSYSVSVTGGTLYTGELSPGGGFNYLYVIVNNGSGNIVSVQSNGDMSNGTTFPTGSYTIYGLSSTSTAASLQTSYGGTSFSAFQTAVLNQAGSLCASLSANSRAVTVTANPLPLTDVRFEASLTGRRSTRCQWTLAAPSTTIRGYDVERSYDGGRYELVSSVAHADRKSFEILDKDLRESADGVYYRLRIIGAGGGQRYSRTVYLPFVQEPLLSSIAVAPNPVAKGMLRAQVAVPAGGAYELKVLDATGRLVSRTSVQLSPGRQFVEFSLPALSHGIYLLRLEGAGISMQTRFVAGDL